MAHFLNLTVRISKDSFMFNFWKQIIIIIIILSIRNDIYVITLMY